jgi:predicted phage terminase large subunit-like protein
MKVENKVSGTGLIQTIRREGIPIIPIQRDRDKISRAHDVAPSLEAGQVMVLDGQPWVADFIAEANAFPNGAHDDQLDPMMDAVSDMMGLTTMTPRVRAL